MKLNSNKCKVMHFGNKNVETVYFIDNGVPKNNQIRDSCCDSWKRCNGESGKSQGTLHSSSLMLTFALKSPKTKKMLSQEVIDEAEIAIESRSEQASQRDDTEDFG